MELIPNWDQVLKRAWSVWLMGAAAALELAMQIVPYLDDVLPKWLVIAVILAGIGARVIPQKGLADE